MLGGYANDIPTTLALDTSGEFIHASAARSNNSLTVQTSSVNFSRDRPFSVFWLRQKLYHAKTVACMAAFSRTSPDA
jgi:hypothetical protein